MRQVRSTYALYRANYHSNTLVQVRSGAPLPLPRIIINRSRYLLLSVSFFPSHSIIQPWASLFISFSSNSPACTQLNVALQTCCPSFCTIPLHQFYLQNHSKWYVASSPQLAFVQPGAVSVWVGASPAGFGPHGCHNSSSLPDHNCDAQFRTRESR